jgi:hypothetical protein
MTEEDCILCPKCRTKACVCRDFDGTWFFICCTCMKESEKFKATEDPDDVVQICVRWKE